MEKGDQTAIAGIVIGLGVAVSALMLPWEISDTLRHIFFWIGAFATLAGALWLLDAHFLSARPKKVRRYLPALTTTVFVAIVGYVEWPRTSPAATKDMLYVECHDSTLPSTIPPEGRIHHVEFGRTNPTKESLRYLAMGEFGGTPGTKTGLEGFQLGFGISECRLTNYKQQTIFNVTIPVKIAYFDMIKHDGGGSQRGNLLVTGDSSITVPRISSGEDKPYVFYFMNSSPFFIDVQFRDSPSYQEGNNQVLAYPIPLRLVGPPVMLDPPPNFWDTTGPPAAPPPTPAPSSTPAGTPPKTLP